MNGEYLHIISFSCNEDLTVNLKFSDGTEKTVDIGGFIRRHPHPQYNKYLKTANFRKCRLVDGNIVWGNDLEFHIEDLYEGRTDDTPAA